MCGRARCTLSPDAILELLHAEKFKNVEKYKQSYNAAPQSYQPVVLLEKDDNEKRVVMAMKWGLVPSFFDSKKQNMNDLRTVNARVENLTTGGIWRRLVDKRRCVIVSEGYYEWKTVPGQRKKQPFFIHVAGSKVTLMAGLYDVWAPPKSFNVKSVKVKEEGEDDQEEEKGSDKLFSYSIVTAEPQQDIGHIHDRMPLILDTDEKVEKWLHPEKYPFSSIVRDLLPSAAKKSSSPLRLEYYEVPSIVGNVQNDGPECCMPLSEWQKKGITSFFAGSSSGPAIKKEEKDSKESVPFVPVKSEPSASSSTTQASKKRALDATSNSGFEDDELEREVVGKEMTVTIKRQKLSPEHTAVARKPRRSRCPYGSLCYRTSALHAKEFSHPKDPDW